MSDQLRVRAVPVEPYEYKTVDGRWMFEKNGGLWTSHQSNDGVWFSIRPGVFNTLAEAVETTLGPDAVIE